MLKDKSMKFVLIKLILLYQSILSPLIRPSCRYTPSCSEYAKIAVLRHGVLRGSLLALKRILRCNPFSGCGHDPVPEKKRNG